MDKGRFKTHFDPYVCHGDTISCQILDIEFTARLEYDHDTSPRDYDAPGCCFDTTDAKYGKKNRAIIEDWGNDEWCYFGLVISAEIDGVSLGDHLASLWGIEGNFPSRRKNPNKYFREVANGLLGEALKAALDEKDRIIKTLTKEIAA